MKLNLDMAGVARPVLSVGKAVGNQVGANVFPFCTIDENKNTQYYATQVSVSDPVEDEKWFACVQYHHSMGVTGKDPKSGETINEIGRAHV